MPLCFAYGSNMDRVAMATRCPASRPLGAARLERHRLVVMREGYLSVARDPRRTVLGLLWDVALADMPALDRYEEVGSGLYTKRQLPVIAGEGPRKALVYLGRNAGPGRPRAGYLEGVLAAAEAARLPPAYLAEIGSLAGPGRNAGAAPARDRPTVRPTRATPRDPEPRRAMTGWRWEP